MKDPVVVEVVDGPEQLHHQALDLPRQEHLALLPHQLHERLEVVRDKVHHDEDLVHVGPNDDLAHRDDVGVLQGSNSIDFENGPKMAPKGFLNCLNVYIYRVTRQLQYYIMLQSIWGVPPVCLPLLQLATAQAGQWNFAN